MRINYLLEVVPNPIKSGDQSLVRITHANVYCPCDDVEFFIRRGDPNSPTAFDDLNSATDWLKAELVEEIVCINDQELFRSDLNEPLNKDEEIPWDGTFEAKLIFPKGKNSIEIKVVSTGPIQSGVISNWTVQVA